jgi:hypothetical protein
MSLSRHWLSVVLVLLLGQPVTGAAPVLREFTVPAAVYTVAFSGDGKLLAAQTGNLILLWDTATGKEVGRISEEPAPSVWSMAFSPDGKLLYAPLGDNSLAAWEVAGGKLARRFKGHTSVVWCLALSPDGKVLASGGEDGTVRVWDAATGKEVRRLAHGGGVWPLAFGPDGRTLASVESAGTLRLWDVKTGEERGRFTADGGAWPMAFAADGKTLATVPWQGTRVRLWDLKGRERRAVDISPGVGWNLAFSPDGRSLAAGGPGNALCLWETATGLERLRRAGHQGPINAVAFSPTGRTLATAGGDNRVLLWDVTGRLKDGRLAPTRPTTEELNDLGKQLAGRDAAKAYRAMWALAAAPDKAVPFLAGQIRPAAPPRADAARVARLIAALDADEFTERESASRELEKLGAAAEGALKKALEASPSAEGARRLEALLKKIGKGDALPEVMAGRRAVEVLEHIGTPAAREALERIVKSGAAPEVCDEARASLRRLAGRK